MTRQIAKEVNRPTEGLHIWWLGNAGFAIRYNEMLMLIDPVLEIRSGDDSVSEIGLKLLHELPLRAKEVEQPDIVMLSHHHGDHAAQETLTVFKGTGAEIICPESCMPLLDRIGVDRTRVRRVVYGQRVEFKSVSIEATRALHGGPHGAVDPNIDWGAGYLVRTGSQVIFHPGDTVLLEDHYGLRNVGILLLPLCRHSQSLMELPSILAPKHIVAMHYDTYDVTEENRFWTYGNPEEVKLRIAYPERLMILRQGEAIRAS